MATIGSLNVNLYARTGAFSKGLKRARKSLNGFSRSIKSSMSGLAGFGGALLAVGAGAGLSNMIKGQFAAIDSTAKLADALDTTTEGVIGMTHAAGLAGVSQDTLTGSYQKMTKSLGMAGQGAAAQVRAFEALGLSHQQLAASDPTESFISILDAIDKLPNAAMKAAAANDIFGRSGMELLPLADAGAEGIRALMAETNTLGTAFSRVDAAKVEQANDAVSRMRAVFTGIAQSVAINLAPVIEDLATRFTNLSTSGGGIGKTVTAAFQKIAYAVGFASDMIEALKIGFTGAQLAVVWLAKTGAQAFGGLLDGILDGLSYLPEWLGGGVAADFSGFFGAFADELERETKRLGNKLQDQLAQPPASDKIDKWFKDINAKSQAQAETTAAKLANSFRGIAPDASGAKDKAQQAIQFERGTLAFGTPSTRRQPQPADPRTITLLETIANLLRGGVPGRLT